MDVGIGGRDETRTLRRVHEQRDVELALGLYDEHSKTGLPETAAGGEAAPQEPRAAARLPSSLGQAYERYLGLPPAFVLAVMWVAGVALLGSIALLMYATGWVLVQVAGSI